MSSITNKEIITRYPAASVTANVWQSYFIYVFPPRTLLLRAESEILMYKKKSVKKVLLQRGSALLLVACTFSL